jgi:Phosphotransferase enzyme family
VIAVPDETAQATPAFVTEALRAGGTIGPDTRVAEVEHEAIGVGVGIVGQLARLSLRYDGPAAGAPGTVVLKLPSQFPENRAVAEHFNFYEREGRFYQQICDKLGVRTPRCFWNLIDLDTRSYGLLLEDLGSRTMISQVAGVGAGRAAQALAALGELHGAWWASPALDSLDWMPRLDDPINLAAGQQYRDAWPVFVERMGTQMPAGALELGERAQVEFEGLLTTGVREAPATICHGDFRIDNLLFDDRADAIDGVAVLDWQISYRGPAITDVAYFLCQSMTVEERRRAEADLVRAWYDAVVRSIGRDLDEYPFELAWEQYRRAALGTTVYRSRASARWIRRTSGATSWSRRWRCARSRPASTSAAPSSSPERPDRA